MEGNKKFVVDTGSARGNNITEEEVHQAIRDMDNWLRTNIPSYSPAGPGAPPPSYPAFLSVLISHHNGGLQLHETFKTISVQEISNVTSRHSSSANWPAQSVPFSSNTEGDLLLVLGSGEVAQWNEDGIIETLSNNLGLFLESIRNKMLTRKFQYLGEDCGLIEGV